MEGTIINQLHALDRSSRFQKGNKSITIQLFLSQNILSYSHGYWRGKSKDGNAENKLEMRWVLELFLTWVEMDEQISFFFPFPFACFPAKSFVFARLNTWLNFEARSVKSGHLKLKRMKMATNCLLLDIHCVPHYPIEIRLWPQSNYQENLNFPICYN